MALSVDSPDACLEPGRFVDSNHPDVVTFARETASGIADPVDRAIKLFYAVRDGFRYDPYRIDFSPAGLRASTVVDQGHGFCVTKAALLAAVCRVCGIPARLGFADVVNHLTSAKLRRVMETDLFVWHGYADLYLNDRWVKATPAFNQSLCERAGVATLDFDGRTDCLYQPHDLKGRRHMEYIRHHGVFLDVPHARILSAFYSTYDAARFVEAGARASADFETEVDHA